MKPVIIILSLVSILCNSVNAEVYQGIEFPDGLASFADQVIQYDPLYQGGPAPTHPDYIDPNQCVGPPDYADPTGSVSLGRGGLIELQFVDNLLTNSGDAAQDLYVFEVGPSTEDMFVAIRPAADTAELLGSSYDDNLDGFYEVGKVYGSTSSIDIDAIFPGFSVGVLFFDAVQLIDDYVLDGIIGGTVGADIDAVGAIESHAPILTVVDPIGGEFIPIGFEYMISWDTIGETGNIIIQYSLDNGSTWNDIDTVDNTGNYQWLVPNVTSEQCLIYIADEDNMTVYDVSDEVFTIYECPLVSPADFNTDCIVDLIDVD